ncbi:MAG: DsbA family oxidoreductase [Gemmatimonadota bacterium]
MTRLLFFHDFASPYCRLALDAVTGAAGRAGLDVRPVPFELWPAPAPIPSPDDARLLNEMETARELAEEWGVPLRKPAVLPRTRKAHEAVAFALARDGAMEVVRRIYDALWAEGRDIARLDVLAEIGEAAGLDREALHVALGTDEFEADVVREQHAAAGAGLEGVPVVQVGHVRASGLLPADDLLAWIEDNR